MIDEHQNVLGEPLEPCGLDPVTGFFRDGTCASNGQDVGSHTICAVVTAEFLQHQRHTGNDLSTPRPEFQFPGLQPGDRWCVVAPRWLHAYEDGIVTPVVLAATHARALQTVSLDILKACAVDVPPDISSIS